MTEEDVNNTEYKVKVMTAFLEGKEIEYKIRDCNSDWRLATTPNWDWVGYEFRIANEKPSIDWSHVHPDYKWLAVDEDGTAWLFSEKPVKYGKYWGAGGNTVPAECFASFNRGEGDWKDSLVERPEGM